MRLPLFVHAVPQTDMVSPSVTLGKGDWRFISDCKDSEVSLHISYLSNLPIPIVSGDSFVLNVTNSVKAVIGKKGTERNITIFVESL